MKKLYKMFFVASILSMSSLALASSQTDCDKMAAIKTGTIITNAPYKHGLCTGRASVTVTQNEDKTTTLTVVPTSFTNTGTGCPLGETDTIDIKTCNDKKSPLKLKPTSIRAELMTGTYKNAYSSEAIGHVAPSKNPIYAASGFYTKGRKTILGIAEVSGHQSTSVLIPLPTTK